MIKLLENGKRRKKNLVIFIHGLTGDETTWTNENGQTFAQLLFSNTALKKNYDIGFFDYYSKIFTSLPLIFIKALFKNLVGSGNTPLKLNLDIDNISDILVTELELKCSDYENIVLIAHSMGGLVAKCTALKLIKKESNVAIERLISLAVPHNGSNIATIVRKVAPNVNSQVSDLATLSDRTTKLINEWLQDETGKLPTIDYLYGKYDLVVHQNSALGFSKEKQNAMAFGVDHAGIAKPLSTEDSVYIAVERILLDVSFIAQINNVLSVKTLPSESEFDDEFFVLKLLIADVHSVSIKTAKISFYNAEFIRKVALQRKMISHSNFEDLMNKIEVLYNNAYALLDTGGLKNGNELVVHIHDQIRKENDGVLNTLEKISYIHKTGMLHQLSNNLNKEIWWGLGHNISTIEDFKKGRD